MWTTTRGPHRGSDRSRCPPAGKSAATRAVGSTTSTITPGRPRGNGRTRSDLQGFSIGVASVDTWWLKATSGSFTPLHRSIRTRIMRLRWSPPPPLPGCRYPQHQRKVRSIILIRYLYRRSTAQNGDTEIHDTAVVRIQHQSKARFTI